MAYMKKKMFIEDALAFEGAMLYKFQPSNAYYAVLGKVPDQFANYKLVLVHYHNTKFMCDRWTTRTRDIIRKKSKMLQFDMCDAYLFEPSRYIEFKQNLDENLPFARSYMFLAYRLCGNKWVSAVDQFDFLKVASVECYPELRRR